MQHAFEILAGEAIQVVGEFQSWAALASAEQTAKNWSLGQTQPSGIKDCASPLREGAER